MPMGCKIYFWSKSEAELRNTERHQLFKKELYPCVSWSREEFLIELAEFKKRHPELFGVEG